jgi:hypothetical protein
VGFLELSFTEIIAVNTTYNEVKNAETEGDTELIPIICNTNPANIKLPKIRPPSQSSFEVRAALARLENRRRATNAIKNLDATITPTTPILEYSFIWDSKEFIACFIQTNVPPHNNVTKNRPITAWRLVAMLSALSLSFSWWRCFFYTVGFRCGMDVATRAPAGAIAACVWPLISVNTSGRCANTLEPDGV